jgi:hypothetical protein
MEYKIIVIILSKMFLFFFSLSFLKVEKFNMRLNDKILLFFALVFVFLFSTFYPIFIEKKEIIIHEFCL